MNLSDISAQLLTNEKAIQRQLALRNPQVELSVVVEPEEIEQIVVSGTRWSKVYRVYFETRGARVVADKVFLTWVLSNPVVLTYNADHIMLENVSGFSNGLQAYGGASVTAKGIPFQWLDFPIEYLSIALTGNGGQTISINGSKPITPTNIDSGNIGIRAWGTYADSFHPRGSR